MFLESTHENKVSIGVIYDQGCLIACGAGAGMSLGGPTQMWLASAFCLLLAGLHLYCL